jgi:ribosomal protein S18 acetylase RimI-like enzyme
MSDHAAPIATRSLEPRDVELLDGWLHGTGLGVRLPASAGWRRVLGDPRILCRVGTADGVPVGFYRLDLAPDRSAEITVVVAPERRRSGVGTALLDAALQQARALGLRRLVAMVAEQNERGREFFHALGFESSPGRASQTVFFARIVHSGDQLAPLEITP